MVSGLAKGIDTAALTTAISAGGSVVAVIGTPLDRAYPIENAPLQEPTGALHDGHNLNVINCKDPGRSRNLVLCHQ